MATTKDDPRKYLDPRTLAKVRSLELKARLIVEGYLSGQHKSPYHGFSVEYSRGRGCSIKGASMRICFSSSRL